MDDDIEAIQDRIKGVQGTLIEIGDVDPETGMCRPEFKPANKKRGLFGMTQKWEYEIPRKCIESHVTPGKRVDGQPKRVCVFQWWEGCHIKFEDTIEGKMQAKLGLEKGQLQAQLDRLTTDNVLLEAEVAKYKRDRAQVSLKHDRLKCNNTVCDKTYTPEDARDRDYVCTCGDDIKRVGE